MSCVCMCVVRCAEGDFFNLLYIYIYIRSALVDVCKLNLRMHGATIKMHGQKLKTSKLPRPG